MKKRILVVEETPGATRAFVETLVRDRRYEVRTAAAGPSALCRAHEFDPHLLIADVPEGGRESLSVVRTLGWVNAVPSLVLAEDGAVEAALRTVPARRRTLPPTADRAQLLESVEALLP